jgi:hypothetical protein
MKLSQAVDLYIQRKRDAGMRFDSPTNILRSFLVKQSNLALGGYVLKSQASENLVRAIDAEEAQVPPWPPCFQ